MRKKRLLIVLLAILATTAVVLAATFVLWTRQPSMLVTMQSYNAKIYSNTKSTPTVIAEADGNPENTSLARTPGNDHQYSAIICFFTITQIDTVTLRISCADIPTYLDVNVSSIDLVTVQWNNGLFWEVASSTNIATNVPINSTVTFPKTSALFDTGVMHNGYNMRVGLVILISEYQISATTDTSATLHPSFDLMT
jgi:hypothetical protein